MIIGALTKTLKSLSTTAGISPKLRTLLSSDLAETTVLVNKAKYDANFRSNFARSLGIPTRELTKITRMINDTPARRKAALGRELKSTLRRATGLNHPTLVQTQNFVRDYLLQELNPYVQEISEQLKLLTENQFNIDDLVALPVTSDLTNVATEILNDLYTAEYINSDGNELIFDNLDNLLSGHFDEYAEDYVENIRERLINSAEGVSVEWDGESLDELPDQTTDLENFLRRD
jgi:hypothetical protein